MIRTVVDDYHWSLWAREQAEGGGYTHLGYQSQSDIYTPPRRGTIDDDGIPLLEISETDRECAREIQRGVEALGQLNIEASKQLIIWHGAMPGAPQKRADRIRMMGINKMAAYDVVGRHRAWVEGWIHATREQRAA